MEVTVKETIFIVSTDDQDYMGNYLFTPPEGITEKRMVSFKNVVHQKLCISGPSNMHLYLCLKNLSLVCEK